MNYKDKENVILAKWEYDDNSVGYKLRTESGVIKSYRIDYDYSEKNPMGGISIRVIVNNDEEQEIKTVINKYSSSNAYENGIIFTSPKLSKILREHNKGK